MLIGPFRVRNLRRPASPSSQAPGSLSRPESRGTVCVVTGREYHTNAIQRPETRLRYYDDEDGELVTVGSSLELMSRLREPIRRRTEAPRLVKPTEVVISEEPSSPVSRPISPDLHVFEIETRGDSQKIWDEIAQRTKELQQDQNVSHPSLITNAAVQNNVPLPTRQIRYTPGHSTGCYHANSQPAMRPVVTWQMEEDPCKDDLSVNMDPSDDASRLQELKEHDERDRQQADEREFYFKVTKPQQISQATDSFSEEPSYTRLASSEAEHEAVAKEETPLLASFHEGNLTEEGKRQAILAGNQLRARTARTNPIRHPKSSRDLKTMSSDRNRWASYSASKPFGLDKAADKSKPKLTLFDEPTKSPELEGSLLQAFQAELAKISKPAAVNRSAFSLTPKVDSSPEGSKGKAPEKKPSPLEPTIYDDPRHSALKTLQNFTNGFQNLASSLRSGLEKEAAGRPMSNQATQAHDALVELFGDFESRMMNISESSELIAEKNEKGKDSVFYENDQFPLRDMLLRSLREVAQGIEALGVEMSSILSSSSNESAPKPLPRSTHEKATEKDTTVIISNLPLSAGWGEVRDLIYSQNGPRNLSGQSSSHGILAITIEPESADFPRRAKCQVLGYEKALKLFQRLDGWYFYNNRLSTSIAPSSDAETPKSNPAMVDPVTGQNGETKSPQATKPSSIPVKQKPFKPVVPSHQQTHLTGKPHSFDYTKIPAVLNTRESKAPSVHFVEPPVMPSKAFEQQSLYPGKESSKFEPTITYRHVSSPMPWDKIGDRRGRQTVKLYPSSSSDDPKNEYENTPAYLKRRSTPATSWQNSGFSYNRLLPSSNIVAGSSPSPLIPPFAKSLLGPEEETLSPRKDVDAESSWYGEPPKCVNSSVAYPITTSTRQTSPPRSAERIASTIHKDSSARRDEQRRIREDYMENLIELTRNKPAQSIRRWRSLHPGSTRTFGDLPSHITSKVNPEPTKPKDLRHARSTGAMKDFDRSASFLPDPVLSEPAIERESPTLKGKARKSFRPWVEDEPVLDTTISTSANEVTKSSQAATRFPTLEQFESRNKASVSRFPPLPSMEPLVPLRANAVNSERNGSVSELSTANVPSLDGSKAFFPALELNDFKAHREAERKPSDEAAEKHDQLIQAINGLADDIKKKSENIKEKYVGSASGNRPFSYKASNDEMRIPLPAGRFQAGDPSTTQWQSWTWGSSLAATAPESVSSLDTVHAIVPETTESSGQFFKRMTGIDDTRNRPTSPLSPVRSPPVAPAARLAGPFDPLAETATIHRHKIIEGVHRAATISSGPDDRWTTRNRRPYSEYFSGNGRMEWDRFVQGYKRPELRISVPGNPHRQSFPAESQPIPPFVPAMNRTAYTHQDGTTSTVTQHGPSFTTVSTTSAPSLSPLANMAAAGTVLTMPLSWFPTGLPHPTAPQTSVTPTAPPAPAVPQPQASSTLPTHHDPTTVSTIQKCVETLKNLGFGSGGPAGVGGADSDRNSGLEDDARLVVYAQAAEGDVNEAIDILEEERRCWDERRRDERGWILE
ncbi:MAG: hypothetical protein MMC33_006209 [Icmadophila ericetorum]|nr:hypothetical protein [Icmadophila ericetorum]